VIPARHSRLFASVFAVYTSALLRRRFAAVYARGSLPETDAPLLVAAQHVGWWDPMVLFHLSRVRFSGTHYTMMEAANLRRLRFFGKLGAFGVDRTSRAETLATMRYALARLAEPRARVWLFPQGAIAPCDKRPLGCDPGASWLAERAGVSVVPVAIRYEFLEEQFPQAFVSFGAPCEAGDVEAMLTAEADSLRDALCSGSLREFDLVLRGRRSISDLFSHETHE
jgi:1-acyl-sn-glycerol-3-phosphate acyltransferase